MAETEGPRGQAPHVLVRVVLRHGSLIAGIELGRLAEWAGLWVGHWAGKSRHTPACLPEKYGRSSMLPHLADAASGGMVTFMERLAADYE